MPKVTTATVGAGRRASSSGEESGFCACEKVFSHSGRCRSVELGFCHVRCGFARIPLYITKYNSYLVPPRLPSNGLVFGSWGALERVPARRAKVKAEYDNESCEFPSPVHW